MRITLEGTNERVPFELTENNEFTILTRSGKETHFKVISFGRQKVDGGMWTYPSDNWQMEAMSISYLTVKTKEELAAEEAIQKAKDVLVNAEHSVRAAEDALKVIKENK